MIKDEKTRCKLLFGPYEPPRTRRGRFLVCEWRGTVKVGDYSDGPIPWPTKWGTRNSLILCGDLVEAVKRESELAVAHHWGVGIKTVQKWRQALGVEVYNPGTQWLQHVQAVDNSPPRKNAAAKRSRTHGHSRTAQAAQMEASHVAIGSVAYSARRADQSRAAALD